MGRKCNVKNSREPGMEIHICNPINQEAEAGGFCEASLSCRVTQCLNSDTVCVRLAFIPAARPLASHTL